ncbi:MAG: GDYXXLXY domain-containing protein [Lentisphaerae bacterium]|nr:GDYXXLXY domain-containing protein [Lentisphaerota bacterium]
MKTAPWVLALMAAMFLAQWAVPASIIWRYEQALANGQVFKFKTRPVDPYDAFRGRYVALGFAQESAPLAGARQRFEGGQKIFALIENDTNGFANGFARIKWVSFERPQTGAYFNVQTRYYSPNWPTNVAIRFPFDRYYLNEKLAPAAEAAYREHSQRGQQDAYVTVRVQNGLAVIEDLYVAGQPILQFLKKQK